MIEQYSWYYKKGYRDFSDLNGKTIVAVEGLEKGSDEVNIRCSDGTSYGMYHEQDCCENVEIDDVCGDVSDLIDATVIDAREDTNREDSFGRSYESCTWTFYNIQTNKGHVQIKWLGESNGYYSEGVSFLKLNSQEK